MTEANEATVEAVGAVSEALEWVERARGDLYSFHQCMGHADLQLGEACDKLRAAGHDDVAERLETEMVGRNGKVVWRQHTTGSFDRMSGLTDIGGRCQVSDSTSSSWSSVSTAKAGAPLLGAVQSI